MLSKHQRQLPVLYGSLWHSASRTAQPTYEKHLQKFDTFAMTFLIIVIMIRDRLPNIHINIFKDITIQKNYKKLLSLIYEI